MKSMKRKLLSLLLAMAMVLTLAPTALAAGEYEVEVSVKSATNAANADGSYPVGTTVTLEATVVSGRDSDDGTLEYSWTAGSGTGETVTITSDTENTIPVSCTVSATKTIQDENGEDTTVTKSGTGSISVKFAAERQPSVATKLTLGAVTPSRLTAGSNGTATVTATVLDQYDAPMAGVSVTATLTSSSTATGATASVGGATGSDGKTTITVSPGSVAGTATFSVSAAGLVDAFSVPVDANKPTVTLAAPTPSNIYYSSTAGAANSTATMKMTTTGDLTNYTLSWTLTNGNALAAALPTTIAESYTLTAANVTTSTTVKIQAVLTNKTDSTDKITSNEVSLTVNPSEVFSLTPSPANNAVINWNTLQSGTGWYTFSVTPKWVSNGNTVTITNSNVEYRWVLNNQTLTSTSSSVSLTASDLAYNQNNSLICRVTFKYADGTKAAERTAEWIINKGYSTSVLATATVSTSTSSYALGDVDDAGKTSIADQLESYFYNTSRNYYGLVSVRFDNVKDGSNGSLNASTGTDYYADRQGSGANPRYLSDVLFYPANTKTTATFQATFYYYNTRNPQSSRDISSMTGAITFNVVESASNGDITYNASIGDDVAFAVKDFEDFYYSKTRGSLSYVTFTLPSGGTLYADGGRLNTSNACYVSPGRTQTDLAGVYFSPTGTTATRASTVRISFAAYGNRSSASGTVAITYLSGTAKDITYNITTSGTLKASDFTNAYREVVGSTAPTGLTIEFQNVPTYGTLSYKDSSRNNATLVTLRDNNIKTYKFTTRTSGANQLGDVTYTASGSHTDTIDYIAYVNNTPQFTGKVVFNSTNASASNMQVGYTSTNGQAVTFSLADFSKANATVMASTSYIRFVTMPTGGTLTYNGAAMTLSSPNVAPASLGLVGYRPNTGFNNSTDRISFLCYDANGNSVGGGQVSIVVTGNGTNNGATIVNSFKDVSATAWYRSDLITLVNAGIIQGRGDGKFDPTAELTYGEALKIFMLASGYPKQAEATGKDWAINYKNLAVSNGWIGSDVDLSAKISRNSMAELAAKSLGLSPSASVPPTWKDGTSNSYANALYYTNPQILIGNADGTFKGNDTLKRQEICAIAARVLTYRSNQQSLVKPDGV